MNILQRKYLFTAVFIAVVSLASCVPVPFSNPVGQQSELPKTSLNKAPELVSRASSVSYSGNPAIIFRMDDVAQGMNEAIVEQIIKLFGRNNVPLSLGIIPHADGKDSYQMPQLKPYIEVGLADISIHGNQHGEKEFDTKQSGISYQILKEGLILARNEIRRYYNVDAISFTIPYDYFSEDGYRAVEDAGFKIFSTQKAVEQYPSVQPVDFQGDWSETGMSRLPIVSDVANWDANSQKWGEIFSDDDSNALFAAIKWGLDNLGIAVVGVHPQAFLDEAGNLSSEKIQKLDAIIKLSKKYGEITTFSAWYSYASKSTIRPPYERKSLTPAYQGGIATIFRMDDGERNVYEEIVEEIIKVFERNEVTLDIGVMPYGGGRNSYEMPMLLRYLDAGVIDVSVHGYKNTFLEFDTELSGTTFDKLDTSLQGCFRDTYGNPNFNPVQTNYQDIKAGLLKARQNFKRYFGITPATITIPYDNFNRDGYLAARDAGFKVLSSILSIDRFPSADYPVDFDGRSDENGMYRLPSVGDVSDWDSAHCSWGDILKIAGPSDPLYETIHDGLNSVIRMGILRIHPQAFANADGKPDSQKLEKLDAIVKYIKNNRDQFGQIITFQSWYDWKSNQK